MYVLKLTLICVHIKNPIRSTFTSIYERLKRVIIEMHNLICTCKVNYMCTIYVHKLYLYRLDNFFPIPGNVESTCMLCSKIGKELFFYIFNILQSSNSVVAPKN